MTDPVPHIMPHPSSFTLGEGVFHLPPLLKVKGDLGGLTGEWLGDLARLYGKEISIIEARDERPHLTITCKKPDAGGPSLETMERYKLNVTPTGLSIEARTPIGVRYAFQSLLMLAEARDGEVVLPAVALDDEPRFRWRGLMLDVARHFMPLDLVKRVIDGMGRVKLNVLHFGLCNNQGFRVESKRFPRLHKVASGGQFFTQDEIKELVDYAAHRGVRVVPEFNMPGHSTAFMVAYPELASGPAPEGLQTSSGVFDDEMNPASQHTDKFVGAFIDEMAALFPDAYWHFGGDEVTGKSWDADPTVQTFMKDMGLQDNKELQALFTMRVQGHLARVGKKSAAWEEVVEGLPSPDTLIMPWISPASHEKFEGYPLVVCTGYYLDHFFRAADYYGFDPEPEDGSRDVLGAEMCLWSEVMCADNLEAIAWPSIAALAERFWSPKETCEAARLRPRLDSVLARLAALGSADLGAPDRLAAKICGGSVPSAVQTLRDYTAPLVYYFALDRANHPHDLTLAFSRLIETLRPETEAARDFDGLVTRALDSDMAPLVTELKRLSHLGEDFARVCDTLPDLAENQALADKIAELASLALEHLEGGTTELVQKIDEIAGPDTPDLKGAVKALGRRRDGTLAHILKETNILILPALKRLVGG